MIAAMAIARRCATISGSRNGLVRARSQLLAELMLALFVTLQNFASTFDDAARQSCQASNFDPVTFVGAPGLDVAKKNNFVGSFFHRDVDVFHRRQEFRKLGEFVIVRGEKRARSRMFLEMFDDGPGDAEAIEGCCSATNFVQKHKA